jgi:hypothetical protein
MKENNSIDAEDSLVCSILCQRVTRDGTEVDIQIYNDDKGGWLLEVVDEFGNSTVWDKLPLLIRHIRPVRLTNYLAHPYRLKTYAIQAK